MRGASREMDHALSKVRFLASFFVAILSFFPDGLAGEGLSLTSGRG